MLVDHQALTCKDVFVPQHLVPSTLWDELGSTGLCGPVYTVDAVVPEDFKMLDMTEDGHVQVLESES